MATLRILVVAHYGDLCDAVVAALNEAGEGAEYATTERDAVQRLQSEVFDVAVIEAIPPRLSIFQPARDEATRRGVSWIAMVTARVPDGAAAVLRMPFSDAELINVVRLVARRTPVRA